MFEPLIAPNPGPSYAEAEAERDPFYDDEPQRTSGPLSRLIDLARGGFSPRSSADDVHEAEMRQSAHESGFDRLEATEPARRDNVSMGRGLNAGAQRPALTSISATPMDSPEMDLDESEMNIPAFLRRQIN
jgi:cell division protein FtsZ